MSGTTAKSHFRPPANLEFGRYDLRLYWLLLLIHGPKFDTIQYEIGAYSY